MSKMHAIRQRLHGEHGQSMVVFVLMMTALIGVVGLVIDGSNLQENRRKLQNAADAAAMAGATDLPNSPGLATTDSLQYLTKNGSGSSEVVGNSVSTTTVSNDTITVSLKRNVPFSFSEVLGLSSSNVTATAKVQVQAVTGMSVPVTSSGQENTAVECENGNACPYAVWAWRRSDDTLHQPGDIVTFRDNSWQGQNIKPNDPNWLGNASDFKGFLRLYTNPPLIQVGDNLTKGADACGQEPINGLIYSYQHNQTVLLPVFGYETDNGNIWLKLVGFDALDLHVPANDGTFKCPGSFQGKIVSYTSLDDYLKTNGGTAPPSFMACGIGQAVCKAKVTQ